VRARSAGATMLAKRGVSSAPLKGRRVLVRVDYNVPLDERGGIADDRRILESIPTLDLLRTRGARTILLSHLGRPGGHRDPKFSLRPVARRLGSALGAPVPLAEEPVGVRALDLAARLENGQFMMLENLRFAPGEEANDPGFAAQLARLGELFVEDAFGAVHRAHASTVGVAQRLPSFAGLLVEREVRELSRLVEGPASPYTVVVGGGKVADKLPLLESLLGRAKTVLIGGAIAYPFLAAGGTRLGATPVEPGLEDAVRAIVPKARAAGTELLLPRDLVYERPGAPEPGVAPAAQFPSDGVAGDIGPDTQRTFRDAVAGSATVFWNGPLGRFEDPRFAGGTRGTFEGLEGRPGFRVAAGGDSARAAYALGVAGAFQFISTGGGAALEFVEGRELPGLAVLPDA
jgi:phosphoglycerate kinase